MKKGAADLMWCLVLFPLRCCCDDKASISDRINSICYRWIHFSKIFLWLELRMQAVKSSHMLWSKAELVLNYICECNCNLQYNCSLQLSPNRLLPCSEWVICDCESFKLCTVKLLYFLVLLHEMYGKFCLAFSGVKVRHQDLLSENYCLA